MLVFLLADGALCDVWLRSHGCLRRGEGREEESGVNNGLGGVKKGEEGGVNRF